MSLEFLNSFLIEIKGGTDWSYFSIKCVQAKQQFLWNILWSYRFWLAWLQFFWFYTCGWPKELKLRMIPHWDGKVPSLSCYSPMSSQQFNILNSGKDLVYTFFLIYTNKWTVITLMPFLALNFSNHLSLSSFYQKTWWCKCFSLLYSSSHEHTHSTSHSELYSWVPTIILLLSRFKALCV